jgi:hypothetical protein
MVPSRDFGMRGQDSIIGFESPTQAVEKWWNTLSVPAMNGMIQPS